MSAARSTRPSASSHSTMRVPRRGTRRANLSSRRLNGTERANRRWLREKISSSRRSAIASSCPSASIALSAPASTNIGGIRVGRSRASRRLLRRHLLDLARGEVEAHALDLVEVGAGDPDEAGVVGIIDRMDGAVLIDAGMSRQQAILLDRLELGLFGIGAVVLALPLDHVGVVRGLAVDRPGRAVVVRRRHPSLVVDMGEDLESEARVLVQYLQAARHLFAAISLDEVAVREQLLELQANLFAALGSAIAGENGAAIRHELIEVVGHCCLLRTTRGLASLIVLANARAMGRRSCLSLHLKSCSSARPRESGDPVLDLDSRFRGNERSLLHGRRSRSPARRWLYPRPGRLRRRARP